MANLVPSVVPPSLHFLPRILLMVTGGLRQSLQLKAKAEDTPDKSLVHRRTDI